MRSYAAQICNLLLNFRDNISFPSSRVKQSHKTAVNIETVCVCVSVRTYTHYIHIDSQRIRLHERLIKISCCCGESFKWTKEVQEMNIADYTKM
jgi:hypothetical protein